MEEYRKALNYSFLLLRYRGRAKQEIRDRLKKKKVSGPTIKAVLRYLEENNYVNDGDFVSNFIREKLSKNWSKSIRTEE